MEHSVYWLRLLLPQWASSLTQLSNLRNSKPSCYPGTTLASWKSYSIVWFYGYFYHWTILFFEEITVNGIQICSVTGQGCRDILMDFVIPELGQYHCLQDIIFMQDSAPLPTDRNIKQLLGQNFTDAWVISRHFPTACPPRSPFITSCGFFVVGFPEG